MTRCCGGVFAAASTDHNTTTPAETRSNAATAPAAPAHGAAPAEAAAIGIPTPVEARPVPTVRVPAIVTAAIEELGLLDGTQAVGRVAKAAFVVDNSGSHDDLAREVDRVWAWLEHLRQARAGQPDEGGVPQ